MGRIRESANAIAAKPKIDDTLAEMMLGYHFLSDERGLVLGMSSAISMPIPITSIVCYRNTFLPFVNMRHFCRVIRAADQEFLTLQSNRQNRNSNSKKPPTSGSGSFPKLGKNP